MTLYSLNSFNREQEVEMEVSDAKKEEWEELTELLNEEIVENLKTNKDFEVTASLSDLFPL